MDLGDPLGSVAMASRVMPRDVLDAQRRGCGCPFLLPMESVGQDVSRVLGSAASCCMTGGHLSSLLSS